MEMADAGPQPPPLLPRGQADCAPDAGLQEAGQEGLLGLSGVKHDVILMLRSTQWGFSFVSLPYWGYFPAYSLPPTP